jgi:Holliday junction resolvase
MSYIIKASGEKEKFEKEKIFQSLKSAGASQKSAAEVCQEVAKDTKPGMNTDDIFKQVLICLQKENPILAARYNLKMAIMKLGPTGFPFEKFIAGILQEYGYKTKTGEQVRGHCVSHEVDVIAEKGKEHFMVECKYHNNRGLKSDVKVALYTYARFLDIKKAWEKLPGHQYLFHQAWLVTNTKCTSQALRFAKCQGLKIISWHYPKGESLNELIENKGLYPITILPSLSEFAEKKLAQNNIILAKDLLKYSQDDLNNTFGIHSDLAKKLREEINGLYSPDF